MVESSRSHLAELCGDDGGGGVLTIAGGHDVAYVGNGGTAHGAPWYAEAPAASSAVTPVSQPSAGKQKADNPAFYAKALSKAFHNAASAVLPAVVTITNSPKAAEQAEEEQLLRTEFGTDSVRIQGHAVRGHVQEQSRISHLLQTDAHAQHAEAGAADELRFGRDRRSVGNRADEQSRRRRRRRHHGRACRTDGSSRRSTLRPIRRATWPCCV